MGIFRRPARVANMASYLQTACDRSQLWVGHSDRQRKTAISWFRSMHMLSLQHLLNNKKFRRGHLSPEDAIPERMLQELLDHLACLDALRQKSQNSSFVDTLSNVFHKSNLAF